MWRLSMADVSEDGVFSNFDGLVRILTVIAGHGMTLKSEDGTLQADPWIPLRFDGSLKIRACLNEGPLTDLNLMYDPNFCNGEVVPLRGPMRQFLKPDRQHVYAVHSLAGIVKFDNDIHLHPGDTLVLSTMAGRVNLNEEDAALLISVTLNKALSKECRLVTE